MIEKIIIEHLEAALDVPVYVMMPDVLPQEFVVIDRTGTSIENRITTTSIVIDSYSSVSTLAAAELADAVNSAMDELNNDANVAGCHMENCIKYTDVVRKIPRYQSTFAITHY